VSTKDWVEKDYYKILGVSKDADTDEIKKSYRKLARELHPDHNKDDPKAEARFKDVSEAHSVLSDPSKRKEYDQARSLFGGGGFGQRGGTTTTTGPDGGFSFDLGDLFNTGQTGTSGGGIGDVLGGLFGGGRPGGRTRTAARRGADVESKATITFEQAVDGVTVPLKMTSASPCSACGGTGAKAGTVPRVCPTCTGTGYTSSNAGGFAIGEPCRDCKGRGMLVDDPCPVCSGSGRGSSSHTIRVRIPAGVDDGQRIRLKGKGAPGENGGRAGDLYIDVTVKPHAVFGRKDEHLTLEVPVTFAEATLGGQISVPTLGGASVKLKIPAGTPSGRVFRVRGRGAPRSDGTKGDLLVTVDVAVPQSLDDDARAAVETLQHSTSGDELRAELLAAARKSS